MNVEWLPIITLTMRKNNPRVHTAKQITQVANSIREFGWTNPILIDKNAIIIAGHCRFLAAQSLDIEQVPVLRLENLTDAQIEAYVIADNKLSEGSKWDIDLLKSSIISLRDTDFNINLLGFELPEIDDIFKQLPHLGQMRKSFTPIVPETAQPAECSTPGEEYPLTFILSHEEIEHWDKAKEQMKAASDRALLFALLAMCDKQASGDIAPDKGGDAK